MTILLVIWQLMILGAILFSPQGWIINGASSYLAGIDGIQESIVLINVVLSFIGAACFSVFWLSIFLYFKRKSEEKTE